MLLAGWWVIVHARPGRRRLDAEQLVGTSEPDVPEPVAVLGARTGRPTYIWYWPDVEAWFRRLGGLGDG